MSVGNTNAVAVRNRPSSRRCGEQGQSLQSIVQRYPALFRLLAAETQSHGACFDIPVADNDDRRVLVGDRSPNLLSHRLVSPVHLDSNGLFPKSVRHLFRIIAMPVGHRDDRCLNRREPDG